VLSQAGPSRWLLELHFATPPDPEAVRALVADIAGEEAAAALAFRTVAARDWVAASLAGLPPVVAGRFVVHGSHDRGRIPRRPIAIEIDAALAFGTGHHGTTRGCLLALDRLLRARSPRRILDIGAGTGVLAIAAAKAVRLRVVASDIDRMAVRVAGANAAANAARAQVRPIQARGLLAPAIRRRAPYDLVFANILLAPLLRLAAPIARVTTPNADVVLSGLLPAQANAAVAAYRTTGFRLIRRFEVEGWTTLWLARC
jgi:ribosomal protein L11 methyltransferase